MSGINPSIDHVSSTNSTLPTDVTGGSTASGVDNKYDNSRHLKYGQTEQKKSDESSLPRQQIRRYSASSDTKPVMMHTFQEEFFGGLTGDDIIKKEEEREKQRKKEHERKKKEHERKKTM